MGPGEDCAMAVMSSISDSSSQPSSSTNFFFISETMTNPPPKVKALSRKVALNSCQRICDFFSSFFIFLKFSLRSFFPLYTSVLQSFFVKNLSCKFYFPNKSKAILVYFSQKSPCCHSAVFRTFFTSNRIHGFQLRFPV